MAYGRDLVGSARRHLAAAILLHDDERPGQIAGSKAVAGYIFGIVGELALKEMMRASGMKPKPEPERRDDPFFKHFPHLKTFLRENAKGRRQGELLRHANDPTLFQHWDTSMRYAPTADVDDRWTAKWKCQAEALVCEMDL